MAIDYNTDILPLFTTSVVTDEPYASVPAALQDNEPERRILTTIEVIRSHMAVLSNRTEANLLQQVLSILMEKVGSGGFVYTSQQLSNIGNVCNPIFPAGASLDITVSGATISPASATGGDIDTVIGELNTAIGAVSTSEETDVTTIADTPSGFLSGKHFFLSDPTDNYYVWMSPNAAIAEVIDVTVDAASLIVGGERFHISSPTTDYYVWYDNRRAEVSAFTSAADVAGSLGGTSFLLNGIDMTPDGVEKNFYVWYNVFRAEVTDVTVPADTEGSLGGTRWHLSSALDVTDYYVWYDFADVAEITDVTLPAGSTFTSSGAGDYWTLNSGGDVTAYYVWYDVSNGNTDPAPGGTGIEIDVTAADSAATVATATQAAINALADFSVPVPGAATITITNAATGFTTDAADGVSSGAGFSVTTQGSASQIDPAPGGRTGISVTLVTNDTAASVATKTATAVGAVADFGATPAGAIVTVTNAAGGATTDAVDVDAGVTPSVTTQGFGPSTDPLSATNGIAVVLNSGDGASAVATATRSAVGAEPEFGTGGAGTSVTITNAFGGAVTDISDVDTGFTEFTASTQGLGANTDDPAPAGRTEIKVTIDSAATAGSVAEATSAAVGGVADFGATDAGAVVTVTNATAGVVSLPFDGSTSEFTSAIVAPGSAAGGTDPGPFAGRTTVTVSYSPGSAASEVAIALSGVVGALADFSAVPTGALVEITNTETGNAPDGTAETSGFTVITAAQGTGLGSIEAFKTSAGKIGFRNVAGTGNISFTLADGSGGILGPAGIFAGDTLARPEVVSAAQIDDAIGAYVAAPRDTALI